MSDFLKNLRSSHKSESGDPKRNMDGHYYPKNDRRKIQDRRITGSAASFETLNERLNDLLPLIAENASIVNMLLEGFESKSDALIDAKIRQYNAVADFFEKLNLWIGDAPAAGPGPVMKASTSYAAGTRYTKDEIIAIMKNLRDKGATFAQIADHLTEKGIPTFSGKGQWHAQTIHRLCRSI